MHDSHAAFWYVQRLDNLGLRSLSTALHWGKEPLKFIARELVGKDAFAGQISRKDT